MTVRTLMDFERKGWAKKTCWVNKWIKGAMLILWLVLSVLFASEGWFTEPRIAWLALFGIIYSGVGFGARATVREWKEETLYWWLSLPAPREKLLLAKALVAFERWASLFSGVFVYIALYIFLVDLAMGAWSWHQFLVRLQIGFAEVLLAIALGPFLVMVGMLLGSFKKSSSKLIVGLLWGLVITTLNLQIKLVGLQFSDKTDPANIIANLNYVILLAEGIVSYGLGFLIFKFISHRLKQGKMLTGD
jgi:hypothetical protein